MTRVALICYSFLLVLAGVAGAWESCKQVSLASRHDHPSGGSHPAHRHHSDSHHEHSDGNSIHCPKLGEFVPTALFSAKPDREEERLIFLTELDLIAQTSRRGSHPRIHGPPGPFHARTYLFLSVLRI